MWLLIEDFWFYIGNESNKLYSWAKSGESGWSVIPTAIWTAGTVALAHRLVTAIFRRFLFRRIPLWEQILQFRLYWLLQQLLFIWVIIYSLHFWSMLVEIIKSALTYYYDDDLQEDPASLTNVRHLFILLFSVFPLAVFIYTRPRRTTQPLMIWITTNPWQRREMGPYGYYLNRPLSTDTVIAPPKTVALRRAYSDSRIMSKEPFKKRRYSKSC